MCGRAKCCFLRLLPCSVGLLLFLPAGNAISQDSFVDRQQRPIPLSMINQSPIQLLFLQLAPDKADTLPKGHTSARFNTTITNTLQSEASAHYRAAIDMEMIRTSLELSYGILSCLEVGLSFPVAHYSSGFMDRPIREVERMSGKIRPERREEKPGHFTYLVMKDDEVLISSCKDTTRIGDVVLRAKARVWDEGDALPRLSARFAVKLPTGDDDRAFGSSEVDWGLGLLLQKDYNKMSFYLNGDVVFPGDAFDYAEVSLKEFYSFMAGVEYVYTSRFSIVAQLSWLTRPFEDTGLDVLDRRIIELLVGVNYRMKNNVYVQTGFMEDVFDSDEAGADFTLFLNTGINF